MKVRVSTQSDSWVKPSPSPAPSDTRRAEVHDRRFMISLSGALELPDTAASWDTQVITGLQVPQPQIHSDISPHLILVLSIL